MAKTYALRQDYIAYENQKVFKIAEPFVKNGIDVYVNGILMTAGESQDYIALPDIGRIIFNKGLIEDDSVSIRGYSREGIDLTVISSGRRDKANALFKRYGSKQKFKYNNKYHIRINLQGKVLNYNFTTKFNPMFCSPKKIFEDIGQFIPEFTEEYVSSMIHRNSIELINLVAELKAAEEPVENVKFETDEDGAYTTSQKIAFSWVRYKTEIDLIYAKYYGISANYGTQEKSIGDISVSKTVKLPYLDELLKRLRRDYNAADEVIRGGFNYVGSAVKAGSTHIYSERGTF